jgi:hypothetical protein
MMAAKEVIMTKPKYVKRSFRFCEWWANPLGIAHFKCIKCKSMLGIGGYYAMPSGDEIVKYNCHTCTRDKYRAQGLRIRYVKGVGETLEPIPDSAAS